MSADDPVWALLADHLGGGDARAAGTQPGPATAARREAAVRLLDAAAGVLVATGHLVAVAEEVVRAQRDRLATDAAGGASATDGAEPGHGARQRIDITY